MGLNRLLGRIVPERRIYITRGDQTSHARLTPLRQIALGMGASALFGFGVWGTALTSAQYFMVPDATASSVVQHAQIDRIEALEADRAHYAAASEAARVRAAELSNTLASLQGDLVRLTQENAVREEMASNLEAAMEASLAAAALLEQERDAARSELTLARYDLRRQQDMAVDLQATVGLVLDGMERTANNRDLIADQLVAMDEEREILETRAIIAEQRQERVFARLEDAVEGGIEQLDQVFRTAGANMDVLMASISADYNGQGGPDLLPDAGVEALGLSDPASLRMTLLLGRIDALNMRRSAAQRMPFGDPVAGAYRLTSGFGTRRDPINGGRRAHNGMDFAGPVGTPIVAPGEGEVTFAGRQSGYGNVIKIRHAFGYETVYAHLHRIHVSVGDRVTRGERIGDMGSTGRSTGSHLHYEIRQGGTPVNPSTYVRAAANVF